MEQATTGLCVFPQKWESLKSEFEEEQKRFIEFCANASKKLCAELFKKQISLRARKLMSLPAWSTGMNLMEYVIFNNIKRVFFPDHPNQIYSLFKISRHDLENAGFKEIFWGGKSPESNFSSIFKKEWEDETGVCVCLRDAPENHHVVDEYEKKIDLWVSADLSDLYSKIA